MKCNKNGASKHVIFELYFSHSHFAQPLTQSLLGNFQTGTYVGRILDLYAEIWEEEGRPHSQRMYCINDRWLIFADLLLSFLQVGFLLQAIDRDQPHTHEISYI